MNSPVNRRESCRLCDSRNDVCVVNVEPIPLSEKYSFNREQVRSPAGRRRVHRKGSLGYDCSVQKDLTCADYRLPETQDRLQVQNTITGGCLDFL